MEMPLCFLKTLLLRGGAMGRGGNVFLCSHHRKKSSSTWKSNKDPVSYYTNGNLCPCTIAIVVRYEIEANTNSTFILYRTIVGLVLEPFKFYSFNQSYSLTISYAFRCMDAK
ncbi:hypothetical protein ACP275_05G124500 [Erythranthe tilingii]